MARQEFMSARMKELVSLLDAFDPADENDRVLFQQLLGEVLEEALPELSDRLVRPSTHWALKRLILGSPGRYPHAGWTAVLMRGLMHETDPALFEEGCRALVQMGGEAQTDALRRIARQRQEEPLQGIVSRKLTFLELRQPFGYHFRDLLLGSQNARLSTQAAQHLAGMAQLTHLGELAAVCDHADTMTAIHAIRVIAGIQHTDAGRFLIERFDSACSELLKDNWLRDAQEQIKRAPAQSVKDVVVERLLSCPGAEPHGEAIRAIAKTLEDPALDALPLVQRLAASIQGLKETRLVSCLADLAIGHSVKTSNLLPDPPDELRARTQRLQGIMDACAEGLTRFSRRGVLDKKEVLPRYLRAYEGGAGGDVFGRAFAELLDDEDQQGLELILKTTNHRWREEAIQVLGERSRPALLPFFMKAMDDPIVDNAHLAIRYFGKLTGAFEAAMALMQSGKADQVERAFGIFSIAGMGQAGPHLVAFLEHAEREDLLIGAIGCLGALKHLPAIPALLDLMRGGQSPRLQKAVAECLVAMDHARAARGLLQKATEIKGTEIHLLAMDGIMRLRFDFQHSLQPDECRWVEQLMESCFDEGGHARYRAVLVAQNLWTLDQPWLERIEHRINQIVADQRKRSTWDRDQQLAVATVMRDLEKRRREQELVASSGRPLKEFVMAYQPGGAEGIQILKSLCTMLEEPGRVLTPETRSELEALVSSELQRSGVDEDSLAWVCRLAGHVASSELISLVLEVHGRTQPRSNLCQICEEALQQLGYPDDPAQARPPIRRVMLLDASAFFRKRLGGSLGAFEVCEAQDRAEAAGLLEGAPVDVLVTELADGEGDLDEWIAQQWRDRKIRLVVLSTSLRTANRFESRPWFLGMLLKPYPVGDLLGLLQAP